jgi:hypothetical protein
LSARFSARFSRPSPAVDHRYISNLPLLGDDGEYVVIGDVLPGSRRTSGSFERRKVTRRYSERMAYTFGDNQEASRRLRRLAEVYEPETRDLLNAVRSAYCDRGFDL